jgi:hypothetical protein
MVIRDLYVFRSRWRPAEIYSKLVIDPDRVLPLAIAREGLEPVARGRPEIVEAYCRVKHDELSLDYGLHVPETPRTPAREEGPGFGTPKRPDHLRSVAIRTLYVNRTSLCRRLPSLSTFAPAFEALPPIVQNRQYRGEKLGRRASEV